LIFFLANAFIQLGIGEFKDLLRKKDKFQAFEKEKASNFVSYRQYGAYGYRILFFPAPLSIWFADSCVVPDMNSFVDSGERLKIYLPLKGKNIFDLKKTGFADFSGILLYFGSLLALFYGFDTFRSREYLKFLSSIAGEKSLFASLVISRILLMWLLFLSIISSGLLLMVFNGVYIPVDKFLAVFTLVVFLTSLFFFLLGTIFSTIRSKKTGITVLLSGWFILLFIIPTAVNMYVKAKSATITTVHQLEMEKLKIFTDFEKKAIEKEGEFSYGKNITDSIRKMIESYCNNEFKIIQSLEVKFLNQMKESISIYQKISMLFPTTFYISVNNEISSRGYNNMFHYYKYALKHKDNFVKYYLERIFFSNFKKVESFIKFNENVFNSSSQIPSTLGWGMLVTFLYIGGAIIISYYRFNRAIHSLPESDTHDKGNENEEIISYPDLDLAKSTLRIFSVEGDLFNCQLFNMLSGKTGVFQKQPLPFRIFINGIDSLSLAQKSNFLYLCHWEHFPGDVTAKDFLYSMARLMKITVKKVNEIAAGINPNLKARFDKPIENLKKQEKGEIALVLIKLKKWDILIIDDVSRGINPLFDVCLQKNMQGLKSNGSLVILLTSDDILRNKSLDTGKYVYETDAWNRVVDSYKKIGHQREAGEERNNYLGV
jgi:ABC-type transport system involved in multi-copper enzyme maturation permease subunit